jgi:hypothetical protein
VSYFVLHEGMPYWKVDWSHRREHVAEKGLTVDQANEALEDPERLVIGPDPRSVTGDSVRIMLLEHSPGGADRRSRHLRQSPVRRYRVEGEQARASSL